MPSAFSRYIFRKMKTLEMTHAHTQIRKFDVTLSMSKGVIGNLGVVAPRSLFGILPFQLLTLSRAS